MRGEQFDLFISYSRRDCDIVYDVVGRLRAMGLVVFLDTWEIKYFTRFADELQDGIQNARACLIFFSENAAKSPPVMAEVNALVTRAMEDREFRVLPVRLDSTELPVLLRSWQWQDLSGATEDGILDFVFSVARRLGVHEPAVVSLEAGAIWAGQAELSAKLLFVLMSLGLKRKEFKPIWRVADILQRGTNFTPRVIQKCECGGTVYCGYADMGNGPYYYDSYFHICDTCFAHKYSSERSSSMTDELPRCPWCRHVWRPAPLVGLGPA